MTTEVRSQKSEVSRLQAARLLIFQRRQRLANLAALEALKREGRKLRAALLLASPDFEAKAETTTLRPIRKTSASMLVFSQFNGHPESIQSLRRATGLPWEKVECAVHSLYRAGRICRVKRGVYQRKAQPA